MPAQLTAVPPDSRAERSQRIDDLKHTTEVLNPDAVEAEAEVVQAREVVRTGPHERIEEVVARLRAKSAQLERELKEARFQIRKQQKGALNLDC